MTGSSTAGTSPGTSPWPCSSNCSRIDNLIGARISALAGAGEILTSATVKDLVAGSGIDFEDRGDHELKGVPGVWRVYLARP